MAHVVPSGPAVLASACINVVYDQLKLVVLRLVAEFLNKLCSSGYTSVTRVAGRAGLSNGGPIRRINPPCWILTRAKHHHGRARVRTGVGDGTGEEADDSRR
jgi:hypothetical protein